jgi:hypothetical protein
MTTTYPVSPFLEDLKSLAPTPLIHPKPSPKNQMSHPFYPGKNIYLAEEKS